MSVFSESRGTNQAPSRCGYHWGVARNMELEQAVDEEPSVTILVVEDEPLLRMAVAESLRECPSVVVVEARTADEAWQYLENYGPVDAVFTDHRMPGEMTGSQLAARVRKQYPSTGILVTSAYYDGTEWTEPVLPKPYDFESTLSRIVRLAREKG